MTHIPLYFDFLSKEKQRHKRGKLSNLLHKHPKDVSKQDKIHLCRRGIPQLHDVDILCIKHGQLKKRDELPNERNQSCMRVKILMLDTSPSVIKSDVDLEHFIV